MATSSQASAPPSSAVVCPFIAGPMITNPSLFIGRTDILHTMTTLLARSPQPTSITIVGEKRIGKSSLLYHFYQTWEQRVAQRDQYVVVYMSLKKAGGNTQQSFYHAIAKELLQQPQVQAKAQLKKGLKTSKPNGSTFANLCDRWKQEQVLPVLCLDEFEVWLNNQQEFDNAFYEHLRSLVDHNTLMLIVASRRSLDEYSKQYQLTSQFFNNGRQLRLEEFSDEDVTELLRQPASITLGTQAALSTDEQDTARQWGDHHPYLLQLAASWLWQARQLGRDQLWAKTQFERESKPSSGKQQHYWTKLLVWLVRRFPQLLGSCVQWMGGSVNNLITGAVGMITLLILVMAIISVLFYHTNPVQVMQNSWHVLKTLLGI